jgi:hypothetical protein
VGAASADARVNMGVQTCVESVSQGEVLAAPRKLLQSAAAQVEVPGALRLVQDALDGHVDFVGGPSARIVHHRTGHVPIEATQTRCRHSFDDSVSQMAELHSQPVRRCAAKHDFLARINSSARFWPVYVDVQWESGDLIT